MEKKYEITWSGLWRLAGMLILAGVFYLKFYQKSVGAVPGPFDSWLILRGVKTLAIRMKKHEEKYLGGDMYPNK